MKERMRCVVFYYQTKKKRITCDEFDLDCIKQVVFISLMAVLIVLWMLMSDAVESSNNRLPWSWFDSVKFSILQNAHFFSVSHVKFVYSFAFAFDFHFSSIFGCFFFSSSFNHSGANFHVIFFLMSQLHTGWMFNSYHWFQNWMNGNKKKCNLITHFFSFDMTISIGFDSHSI